MRGGVLTPRAKSLPEIGRLFKGEGAEEASLPAISPNVVEYYLCNSMYSTVITTTTNIYQPSTMEKPSRFAIYLGGETPQILRDPTKVDRDTIVFGGSVMDVRAVTIKPPGSSKPIKGKGLKGEEDPLLNLEAPFLLLGEKFPEELTYSFPSPPLQHVPVAVPACNS